MKRLIAQTWACLLFGWFCRLRVRACQGAASAITISPCCALNKSVYQIDGNRQYRQSVVRIVLNNPQAEQPIQGREPDGSQHTTCAHSPFRIARTWACLLFGWFCRLRVRACKGAAAALFLGGLPKLQYNCGSHASACKKHRHKVHHVSALLQAIIAQQVNGGLSTTEENL